jgi:fatty acid-binding protein DegV
MAERKYFLEEHERMVNRMVPPAGEDGEAAVSPAALESLPSLADATAAAATLEGKLMAQLLVGGFVHLNGNMDRLNKENEFPIPDGDTGTNMVVCFKKAVRQMVAATAAAAEPTLISVMEGFADDVVMNGQGNSGTILSHFWKTFADEVKKLGKPAVSVAEFAALLETTGASMNNAVPDLFEGTMISCARDGSTGLGDGHETVQSLIAAWAAKTSEACLATHTQLEKDGKKVLEGTMGLDGKPKVDSGASGFLNIVQGLAGACDGTITAAQMQDSSQLNPMGMATDGAAIVSEARGNLPEYPFQYCTEAAIKLKPGVTEEDVKKTFEEYQASGACDSVACVCTSSLAKVHVHTNEPGAVFKMCQTQFNVDDILLKEKVEDMYVERDQATQGAAFDMSKAKVHIVTDAFAQSYHELEHATVLPLWLIDGVEPMILGDPRANSFDVANANRHFLKETGKPKVLSTAAPTPEQVEPMFRKALDICHNSEAEDILCITFSSMMSAYHRNVCAAVGKAPDCSDLPDDKMKCTLPAEARKRIHIYDSGYLGQNDIMSREAMRCAEKGMSLDEIMERVKYVENRIYSVFIFGAETKQALAAWGRVMKNLKGEKLTADEVPSGKVYSMGTRPGNTGPYGGKLGEWVIGGPRTLPPGAPAPPQAFKAMNAFAPLGEVDEGPDAITELMAAELEAIKYDDCWI